MSKKNKGFNRRRLLKGVCAAAASAAVSPALFGALRGRSAQAAGPDTRPPKFLIVLAGFGGASIIDSFMALTHTGVGDNFANINCFPDADVTQIGEFTAVKAAAASIGQLPFAFDTDQNAFVTKHQNDMMVMTQTVTSVNHVVAQKRSVTGNGAWQGRTLQEAVAMEYGEHMPLPNVNMASMGYLEHGTDPSVPAFAYNEPVAQPSLWPLSLDAAKGIKDLPGRDVINLARSLRNDNLDPNSTFLKTFGASQRLQRWRQQREQQAPLLEERDLITSLNLLPDAPPTIPLSEFGLTESPDASVIRAAFPAFLTDPLEAQAALAYLLIKNKLTCAVTIAPTFNLVFSGSSVANPPLAFDYSHAGHRGAQAVMWARTLGIADRLITLLKSEEFDSATGESFWDRSLIYVATDFGRTKKRSNAETIFSTSHDLNNGNLILSPMANGGKVLGGVRIDGTTYGYNPQTGAPDMNVEMSEAQTYGGILQALDVDTSGSGLPDMPAMRKNG